MPRITVQWDAPVFWTDQTGLTFWNEAIGALATAVVPVTAPGSDLIEYDVDWGVADDPLGGQTLRLEYDGFAGNYEDAGGEGLQTQSMSFDTCYEHTPLADVPTLAHFFRATETEGVLSSDAQGGVVCEPTQISFGQDWVRPHEPLSLSSNGLGSGIDSKALTSGAWADHGTNSFLCIAAVVLDQETPTDSANLKIGNRQDPGDVFPGFSIGLSSANADIGGGPNVNGGDDLDYHYVARPTFGEPAIGVNGTAYILDLVCDRVAGTVTYNIRDAEGNILKTDQVTLPVGTGPNAVTYDLANAMTPEAFFKFRGFRVYGSADFIFSAAPPLNVNGGIIWMGEAWLGGHKEVDPRTTAWT